MEKIPSFLKNFEEDEIFYKICTELIIKADGDPDILGRLGSAIYSAGGPTSRTIGQPSNKVSNRMKYLKSIETHENIQIKRFVQKQIKATEELIKDELEHDEDFE